MRRLFRLRRRRAGMGISCSSRATSIPPRVFDQMNWELARGTAIKDSYADAAWTALSREKLSQIGKSVRNILNWLKRLLGR